MTKALWSRTYLGLWVAWMGLATYLAVVGGHANRQWWWGMVGSGLLLEALGGLKRGDKLPMLTEVFGRYVPGFVLFPILALAIWRLSLWVPGWILFPGAGWQLWHFVATYHSFQKLGGKS